MKRKRQILLFGANIAHLYYDSFFMENGQIGEFAKERILEAINYVQNPNHPDYQKDSEKIRYIIAHIGDEYMKKKIGLEFLMKNGKMRSIINDFLNYQLENEPLLSEEESELEP